MTDPFEHNAGRPDEAGPRLSDADAGALDALIGAAFAQPGAGAEARVLRVHDLLATLEPDDSLAAPDRSLVDVTVARALRSRRGGEEREWSGALTADDADALDALVACEWDDEALPARATRRGLRIARLVDLLRPASVQATGMDDLVERTLLRVRLSAAEPLVERARLGLPGGGFRLSDLIAVAAMLLIGVSVLWPTVGAMRVDSMRASCATGLANAGVGFALYANDNQGRMPAVEGSISASLPGSGAWWEVGSPTKSHSANLFVLVREGYVDQRDLACRGNRHAPVGLDIHLHEDWRSPDEVSYSFQLFAGPARRLPIRPDAVLLSDRSPLVIRAMQHEAGDPESRSPNHAGAGQNVLFADRSVRWLVRPVTPRGDNIWLPASLSGEGPVRLIGNETPSGPDDAFVGP